MTELIYGTSQRKFVKYALKWVWFSVSRISAFEETVYKDISFGPFNKGLSQEEIDKEVRRAAKFTGIKDELLYKSPFDLSGGEKRRAAIAGVIAMDPDVLVLDEPTAGLDPMGRDVLLSQIVRYHKDRQNTVLLVSHSMEDIARVADRIVVMNKSKLVMFDETQKVLREVTSLKNRSAYSADNKNNVTAQKKGSRCT